MGFCCCSPIRMSGARQDLRVYLHRATHPGAGSAAVRSGAETVGKAGVPYVCLYPNEEPEVMDRKLVEFLRFRLDLFPTAIGSATISAACSTRRH